MVDEWMANELAHSKIAAYENTKDSKGEVEEAEVNKQKDWNHCGMSLHSTSTF